jgi:hypothetical protein
LAQQRWLAEPFGAGNQLPRFLLKRLNRSAVVVKLPHEVSLRL